MSVSIRVEEPADHDVVRAINVEAFGGPVEARLVDRLRALGDAALSLVAVDDDTRDVIGHILFTPVTLDRGPTGMGLAPMAVRRSAQRRGIGSALVSEGLRTLGTRGCPFVVVVGHADYYPRFGFEPASARGLESQWSGMPDEAFMVIVLDEAAMAGKAGVVRYREEFDEVT